MSVGVDFGVVRKKERETRTCKQCGRFFEYLNTPSRGPNRGQFCSPACQRRGRDFHTVSPNWKGGRVLRPDGRIEIHVRRTDPYSDMRSASGYVLEHRLVMARELGRSLLPTETVHHINGDPADNRAENLQLRVRSHGEGQAYRCSVCGSTKIEPVEI